MAELKSGETSTDKKTDTPRNFDETRSSGRLKLYGRFEVDAYDDDRIGLRVGAFDALRVSPDAAISDRLIAVKGGKEAPRVVRNSADLKTVKFHDGSSPKLGETWSSKQAIEDRFHNCDTAAVVDDLKSVLIELDKINNGCVVLVSADCVIAKPLAGIMPALPGRDRRSRRLCRTARLGKRVRRRKAIRVRENLRPEATHAGPLRPGSFGAFATKKLDALEIWEADDRGRLLMNAAKLRRHNQKGVCLALIFGPKRTGR